MNGVLEIPRKNLWRLEANELPSSFEFRGVPSSPAFLSACPAVVPCTTSGSGVLVRNVFPVPFEFCQFDFDYCLSNDGFYLRNNLFYDDFISSWRQAAIWSLNYWIVIPTSGFHGNINKCEFRKLKFKILYKTSIFWRWYDLEMYSFELDFRQIWLQLKSFELG